MSDERAQAMADLRRSYAREVLDEAHVEGDPIMQFERWFQQALAAHLTEPNAMMLATAAADGTPAVRTVLLKGADARGFVFYTNYESDKGRELAANPRAAVCLYWAELERQVRISGAVERTAPEESERYYRSRPLGSRRGAWVSRQSAVISGRGELEGELARVVERFGEDPPLPPFWGGYRVAPAWIEFWQGRPDRLHDRLRYTRQADGAWLLQRLAP